MWLVGILSLIVIIGGITALLGRKRNPAPFATDFDLDSLSASYARITAPLGAFSVAGAVFLANLIREVENVFFVDVMALFLIAFIMLMATAIIYATFRSAKLLSLPDHHHDVHCMLFIICNLLFYMSLSVSWVGLRPLLLSIELSSLADVFTWVLLFSLLAGAIRLGAWLHTLLGIRFLQSVFIPVIPIVAVVIYAQALAPRFTLLWPEANPVLTFAILVFAVGAIGGGVETAMITFYGNREAHHRIQRIGNMLIAPYVSAGIAAVTLLWFSIASL